MKILKISNPAYSIDKHNLRYLLSKTPLEKDDYAMITRFENEQGTFIDCRILGGNKSVIQLDKSRLEIDASNGKILSCTKPFFKNMKKLVNRANEFLSTIITNINDDSKVRKSQTGIFVAGGKQFDEMVRIANENLRKKPVNKTTLEIGLFPREVIKRIQEGCKNLIGQWEKDGKIS